MCLRFAFLLITRVTAWLRLSRREDAWKTAEILILRHQLTVLQRRRPRRPQLNWADRALLAALLGVIQKARRRGLRLLVTPDTIVRWHRDIVRRRWARPVGARQDWPTCDPAEHQGPDPPAGSREPRMGYRRIHGELAGLGVNIAASTVWEILKASGISPGRRRTGPTWPQFLRSQAEAILACDFFTAGLPGGSQAYVLAVIEHATRRIRILGVTLHPTGQWTAQQARNLLMDLGEQADRVRFMIRDCGPDFTAAFDAVLADAGIRALQHPDAPDERDHRTLDRRMPPRAPGPHPHLEHGPSVADPAHVRDAPQSAPATPLPARRRAAETATRTSLSRRLPRPKTGSRRWPDKRIPPGRMTWTRFSARAVHRSVAAQATVLECAGRSARVRACCGTSLLYR